MRNLVEYPITADEVLEVVNRALERDNVRKAIGGIDGCVLHTLYQYLIDNPEAVDDITEMLRV